MALRSARGIREGGASRQCLSAAAHFNGNIDNGARFGYHVPREVRERHALPHLLEET